MRGDSSTWPARFLGVGMSVVNRSFLAICRAKNHPCKRVGRWAGDGKTRSEREVLAQSTPRWTACERLVCLPRPAVSLGRNGLRRRESAVSRRLRAVLVWSILDERPLLCARARQRPARARSGLRLSRRYRGCLSLGLWRGLWFERFEPSPAPRRRHNELLLGERGVGVGPPPGLRLRLGFRFFCLVGLRGFGFGSFGLRRLGRVHLGEDLLELGGRLLSRRLLLLGALGRLQLRELLVGRQRAALGDHLGLDLDA